jgi:hypothetical protein
MIGQAIGARDNHVIFGTKTSRSSQSQREDDALTTAAPGRCFEADRGTVLACN